MLHVRVDEQDTERLARLAVHFELSESAVVRMLIKQAVEALPPAVPEKVRGRRK